MSVIEKFVKSVQNNEIGLIGLNQDLSRNPSRYATTDHLPPSRYAACFENRMIILIAALRGASFWTDVASLLRELVLKRLKHRSTIHQPTRCGAAEEEIPGYLEALHLCSSDNQALEKSLEVTDGTQARMRTRKH
ncbi:hypothetical protein E3N88_44816 [Mikania micrantha]|uniref:Uncharacterized protein n=1 Tax=Mikania micrantha TaxID=192012 RepID=A0A5N6LD97_9ASTR|nr:hypothetical protein E3N88_44816 [Mikania micrantha]